MADGGQPLNAPGAEVSPWLRLAALALAGAVSVLVLGAADRHSVEVRLVPGGTWDGLVFREFHGYQPQARVLGGSHHSRIVLDGLWAGRPASVVLVLATQGGPRRARVLANESPVGEFRLDEVPAPVVFVVPADERGRLVVRFTGVRSDEVIVRVSSLELQQRGQPAVPAARGLAYAVLGTSWFGLVWRLRRRWALPAVSLLLVLAGLSLWIHAGRAHALAVLPWAATGLGAGEGWLLGGELCAAAIGASQGAARWVVLALGLKVVLMAQPDFLSIDAPWHTRNLWQFREGALTSSSAPGLAAVPYPPVAYAVLAPFATGSSRDFDLSLVRLAMALFEGAAPLLVFWLVRSAGGSRAAAGGAAAAAAVMPEGLLVLAKGILCNVFASLAGLAALVALVRGAWSVLATAALALVCLSHAGGAAALLALVGVWSLLQYRYRELDRRGLLLRFAQIACAVAAAWLVYYREAPFALERPGSSPVYPAVLYVRWYRVGKILQDLLLKFGLAPLVLAAYGWPRASAPLRTLLKAWYLTAGALAAIAVLTPFPVRFEYFVLPAVAVAAGLGLERLARESGRPLLGVLALAATLALQARVGTLILQGRFEMISVIMESPRWRFPVLR